MFSHTIIKGQSQDIWLWIQGKLIFFLFIFEIISS